MSSCSATHEEADMSESKASRAEREQAEQEAEERGGEDERPQGTVLVIEQGGALEAAAANYHNAVPGVGPVAVNDGYHAVTLRSGVVQYYADHDGWNSPDQDMVRAHVADYRARRGGRVSG
jgi:hypothetical protein